MVQTSLLYAGGLLPPDTYTVSQLGEELQLILSETLSGLWVAGEVRRLTRSRAGHLYFELVEKGAGDSVVGSIQAVLFRRDFQRVQRRLDRSGIELKEGQAIRCFGGVDFYPAGGRLQLIARDVDPLFSLGEMAMRRQQTLEELTKCGLLDRNGLVPLPILPLRIALVASRGSAADRDFTSTIDASLYAFQVRPFDVVVQGAAAEAEIVQALQRCGEPDWCDRLDAVVVIRGGGSKTDLAAFDSFAVAEAIARCPLPVLTGLGHQIDEAVADMVAHRAFKTPTAVAEFLCQEVSALAHELERLAERLRTVGGTRLSDAARLFSAAELRLLAASRGLERASANLERLTERLRLLSRGLTREAERRMLALGTRLDRAAAPYLKRAHVQSDELGFRLSRVSVAMLKAANERLLQQQRWIDQLSPDRTLRRGFSISRDASGAIVRCASVMQEGDVLLTELSEGQLASRITGPRSDAIQ